MLEGKYTEGPWELVQVDELCITIMGAGGKQLESQALDFCFHCDDDESIYNGYLMSAAPELYESLEYLLKDFESRTADELDFERDAVIHQARAALAKARGEGNNLMKVMAFDYAKICEEANEAYRRRRKKTPK